MARNPTLRPTTGMWGAHGLWTTIVGVTFNLTIQVSHDQPVAYQVLELEIDLVISYPGDALLHRRDHRRLHAPHHGRKATRKTGLCPS